jgi:flagellar biosynthesis/type III secretory pathway protein FliH
MMFDGPKKVGRFIKKGSKVLGKVALTEFSFQEICAAPVVSHDNQSRSIIHSKFHEPVHLEKNVQAPEKFDADLQNENQRRPLLRPLDFTRDWERDKKLRKSRHARLGDEDEIDYEMDQDEDEDGDGFQAGVVPAVAASGDAKSAASAAAGEPKQAPKTNINADANAKPGDPAGNPNQQEGPRYDSMDIVGKAIKNLMHHDEAGTPEQPLSAGNVKAGVAKAPAPQAPVAAAATPVAQSTAPQADAFIPATTQGTAGQQATHDPEAEAAKLYQQRLAEQKLIEERAAAAIEEAKAKGYRDGFVLGEEKAELQARQKSAAVFGKVGELIHEFAGLKTEILNNVQENFYELCQAMAEALLKREFSIKPETFATVLRRAVSDAVEPGEFKIRVHPEMFDRISALGDAALTKTLVKDAEVAVGDFKIESDLSVVDGQVGKLIKDLLEQADLNIFDVDDAKKAG